MMRGYLLPPSSVQGGGWGLCHHTVCQPALRVLRHISVPLSPSRLREGKEGKRKLLEHHCEPPRCGTFGAISSRGGGAASGAAPPFRAAPGPLRNAGAAAGGGRGAGRGGQRGAGPAATTTTTSSTSSTTSATAGGP